MKRLCIIGNSHAACLKNAWESGGFDKEKMELTFFADRAESIGGLRVERSGLVPSNDKLKEALAFTSGGRDFIDPCSYDYILVYGLGLTLPQWSDIHYSQQTVSLAYKSWVEHSVSYQVIRMLHGLTDKPVYVGPEPLPALHRPEALRSRTYSWSFRRMQETVFDELGATLVPQPKETFNGAFCTDPAYSVGSTRLAIGSDDDSEQHPEDDILHMNDAYGRVYLASFFDQFLWTRRTKGEIDQAFT